MNAASEITANRNCVEFNAELFDENTQQTQQEPATPRRAAWDFKTAWRIFLWGLLALGVLIIARMLYVKGQPELTPGATAIIATPVDVVERRQSYDEADSVNAVTEAVSDKTEIQEPEQPQKTQTFEVDRVEAMTGQLQAMQTTVAELHDALTGMQDWRQTIDQHMVGLTEEIGHLNQSLQTIGRLSLDEETELVRQLSAKMQEVTVLKAQRQAQPPFQMESLMIWGDDLIVTLKVQDQYREARIGDIVEGWRLQDVAGNTASWVRLTDGVEAQLGVNL